MRNDHKPISVLHHRFEAHATRPATGAMATHDHAVVGFFVSGRAEFLQREQHVVVAGDLQLLPPGEPHRLVSAVDVEAWSVGFCASCIAVTDLQPLLAPFSRVRAGASPILRVPAVRQAVLIERFKNLQASLLDDDATAAIVSRSWLALLLAEVKAIDAMVAPTTPRPSIVADALAYIEQHCLEAITLTDIAAAVSRTPSYVTSVLTRSTGKSAGAWVMAGRMSEARRRLLHTDERIDIVAERVGYADVAHFTRLFSRAHAMPPGAWRARHRASSAP